MGSSPTAHSASHIAAPGVAMLRCPPSFSGNGPGCASQILLWGGCRNCVGGGGGGGGKTQATVPTIWLKLQEVDLRPFSQIATQYVSLAKGGNGKRIVWGEEDRGRGLQHRGIFISLCGVAETPCFIPGPVYHHNPGQRASGCQDSLLYGKQWATTWCLR